MDSKQARELLEAMAGAGQWEWVLHPHFDDANEAAHGAETVGEQVSAFIFRQIVDRWEKGERPTTAKVIVRVDMT